MQDLLKYAVYYGKICIGVFGGENVGIKPTHNSKSFLLSVVPCQSPGCNSKFKLIKQDDGQHLLGPICKKESMVFSTKYGQGCSQAASGQARGSSQLPHFSLVLTPNLLVCGFPTSQPSIDFTPQPQPPGPTSPLHSMPSLNPTVLSSRKKWPSVSSVRPSPPPHLWLQVNHSQPPHLGLGYPPTGHQALPGAYGYRR